MILVDSSVWIDYFRGTRTPQTDALHDLLGQEPVAIGDLILTEVLQGLRAERDFHQAHRALTALAVIELGGRDVAIKAAKNFRVLRRRGVTIRKTIALSGGSLAFRAVEYSIAGRMDSLPAAVL